MGWQDAPVVGGGSWQSAPVVDPEEGGIGGYIKSEMKAIPGRLGNMVAGGAKGASQIGATLLAPYDMAKDAIDGKGLSLESNRQRRKDVTGALEGFGADPSSIQFKAGEIGTEIAGTLGAGNILSLGARALPFAGRGADAVATALRTGGFRTGQTLPAAQNWAARIGAGTAVGATAAGMVDPETAGTGAIIGGALPPAAKLAGEAAKIVRSAFARAKTPQEFKIAQQLAQQLGVTADDLKAVITGPQMIPGYQQTVPQIVQDPVASQLQRTLQTAGRQDIANAGKVQQGQFQDALGNIAPIGSTVQDTANRAGSAIQQFALPAREQATNRVRSAFDSVDPFNESALYLPIDEMAKAQGKYLGAGTFGTGGKASEALATARRVGMEELPAVPALARETASNSQTLERAVRAAGGINLGRSGMGGELRDLGIRQSGTTGLINSKSGQAPDLLAEAMHRRGFIPDSDPATLLEALRNGGGRKVYANDQVESNAMQRMAEAAMGDAPGASAAPKTVPFQTVQNLRSSIGEAAEQASTKGANKEAAALRQMVAEIDSSVNRSAGGAAQAGENFPRDMADQYRTALKLHADKMRQFETGPQAGMFRKGADGQPSIQGAEIPGKFFNGNRSQVEDVQSFRRLVGNREDLTRELKSYALTEGVDKATSGGNLGDSFINWLKSRSGATGELFNAQERATINEVAKAVRRQMGAENLGRVSGPDTAQKLASLESNGLLDSRAVDVLARRIPMLGSFTGPMLDGLRATAAKTRQGYMAGLLSDPARFAAALESQQRIGGGLLNMAPEPALLTRGLYRTAPLLGSQ